jgi:hypothetical protein
MTVSKRETADGGETENERVVRKSRLVTPWLAATAFSLLTGCSPGPEPDTDRSSEASAAGPAFDRFQAETFSVSGAQPNAWADYDRDGDLDLFVGFRGRENRLYRNDGDGFVDVGALVGLGAQPTPDAETRAAAWGDFDGDGDLDIYLGFAEASRTPVPDRLYRNEEGGERFVDVSAEVGLRVAGATRQPAFVDYDGDGDVDLFVALRDQPNQLHRNDGGVFTDVTERSGIGDPRRTVSAAWFDFDADGDLDVFVANQNGDDDGFFENLGDGTFVDIAPQLGMHQPGRSEVQGSVGTALADYDADGDLDLFVASYGPDLIWENLSPEVGFEMRSAGTGLEGDHHSVAAAWGDYDNDGRADLYVDGFLSGVAEEPDHLYRNLGDRRFETVTPASMLERGASHGVAWADFDRDGDLDLALANNDPGAGTHPLYRNLLPDSIASRSLQVVVLDDAGLWTRAGSEVRVRDARSGRLLGTRMVSTGGGYSSQGAVPLHFGLPPGTGLVDVEVTVLERGKRVVVLVDDVDPAAYGGRYLEVRR